MLEKHVRLGSTPKSVGRWIIERKSSIKPSAFDQYSEAVVLKVAISVCSSLDEFHFSVKAFGDSVVLEVSPHSDDGGIPFPDGESYFLHFRRSLMSEHEHHFPEFSYVSFALLYILRFDSQEVTELFLEVMRDANSGVEFKELMQGLLFPGGEVAGSFSQGMDDEAFPAYGLLSLFAEFHKVVLDHADDVEAIRYYFGVGEAFADDVSVA